MVRKFFILFLFSTLVYTDAEIYGQRIKGEIIAGMNLSQVDGDEIYGFDKAGLNMGLGAIVPLGKHFAFSIETLFNQKGSYQGKQEEDVVTDSLGNIIAIWTKEYKLKLDYLEVPVMIHFVDKDILAVGTGFRTDAWLTLRNGNRVSLWKVPLSTADLTTGMTTMYSLISISGYTKKSAGLSSIFDMLIQSVKYGHGIFMINSEYIQEPAINITTCFQSG